MAATKRFDKTLKIAITAEDADKLLVRARVSGNRTVSQYVRDAALRENSRVSDDTRLILEQLGRLEEILVKLTTYLGEYGVLSREVAEDTRTAVNSMRPGMFAALALKNMGRKDG